MQTFASLIQVAGIVVSVGDFLEVLWTANAFDT